MMITISRFIPVCHNVVNAMKCMWSLLTLFFMKQINVTARVIRVILVDNLISRSLVLFKKVNKISKAEIKKFPKCKILVPSEKNFPPLENMS
jgi:hypothetical protein